MKLGLKEQMEIATVRMQIRELKASDILMRQSLEERLMGYYKKFVLSIFLETFLEHYGTGVDQNSIVHSLQFKYSGFIGNRKPTFKFDPNRIKFRADFAYDIERFNYNVKPNTLQTGIVPDYDILTEHSFAGADERMGNIAFNKEYAQECESTFIPLSNEDRYGTFNRINRLKGYTPVSEVGQEATK